MVAVLLLLQAAVSLEVSQRVRVEQEEQEQEEQAAQQWVEEVATVVNQAKLVQ